MSLLGWLRRVADESHASHRLASRWHWSHALAYLLLMGGYAGMIAFHVTAARRHGRIASRMATAGRSETWDDEG